MQQEFGGLSRRETELLKQQILTGCGIELVSHYRVILVLLFAKKEVHWFNKPQLTRKNTPLI